MTMTDRWTEEDVQAALRDNVDLARRNPGFVISAGKGNTFKDCTAGAVPVRKYHNDPCEYHGRRYDSVKEATRAQQLDILQAEGEIIGWIPQWTFRLQAGIGYRADFVVLLPGGTFRVEDTKGVLTPHFKDKAKLFRERFGFDITII